MNQNKMAISKLFQNTFTHFSKRVVFYALVQLIVYVILLIATYYVIPDSYYEISGESINLTAFNANLVIIAIVVSLLISIFGEAATYEYASRKPAARQALKGGWRRILGYIGAYLAVYAVVIVGLFLFIIPGILAAAAFFLTPMVLAKEHKLSLTRSFRIVKQNYWSIFLVLLVSSCILLLISSIPYVGILATLVSSGWIASLAAIVYESSNGANSEPRKS